MRTRAARAEASSGARAASARRAPVRLAECAACHDQGMASNCVACHAPGGSGPSPHGPGFRRPLDRNQDRVCRACHAQRPP
ncbi:MAG: cytochrome c3 family protein [Myxococcota bacterium]